MKILAILAYLHIALTLFGGEVSISPHQYLLKENLKDKLKWTMSTGTLEFTQDGETCELKDEVGKVIYRWEAPLEVSGVIASEKGTALLVQVMTNKGVYHGLTRFVLEGKTWRVSQVMLNNHPLIEIRDRWVSELGALSDDGGSAILRVGTADSDKSPERKGYRMFYEWETWDLGETKMIGSGLKMCNANK